MLFSGDPVRVGLLRMDELSEYAQHVMGNYPELYAHMFRNENAEITDIKVHKGDGPASLDDFDAWILGGSRTSVYDDEPWVAEALEITRRLVAEERPVFGICFGHQLMAQALGGKVAKADAGWGIGVHAYQTNQTLPWFPEGDEQITILTSHQDQVVDVPGDTVVWSSSEFCPVAGMLIGERAWSTQGHPELTPPVCEAIYDYRRDRLGDDLVDTALATLNNPLSNEAFAAAITRQGRS